MILSALCLAGCSENEDMPAPSGNAIGFSATAPKGSRASATTTATLQDFVVYAYSDTEQIMDGVVVSRNGDRGHILRRSIGRHRLSISMPSARRLTDVRARLPHPRRTTT